jgi:hypothetical protein
MGLGASPRRSNPTRAPRQVSALPGACARRVAARARDRQGRPNGRLARPPCSAPAARVAASTKARPAQRHQPAERGRRGEGSHDVFTRDPKRLRDADDDLMRGLLRRGQAALRRYEEKLDPNWPPASERSPRTARQKPQICRIFLESGRQDLNLRPPGPQPGALPDCATPRGPPIITGRGRRAAPGLGWTILTDRTSAERATGIEPALEAWKASVQPQHFARR